MTMMERMGFWSNNLINLDVVEVTDKGVKFDGLQEFVRIMNLLSHDILSCLDKQDRDTLKQIYTKYFNLYQDLEKELAKEDELSSTPEKMNRDKKDYIESEKHLWEEKKKRDCLIYLDKIIDELTSGVTLCNNDSKVSISLEMHKLPVNVILPSSDYIEVAKGTVSIENNISKDITITLKSNRTELVQFLFKYRGLIIDKYSELKFDPSYD